jgi:diaminohydroxyphosphoribosylaminopyrimidine deaminase / 5-amino-6-(5-phosphoribosylamino)uracil reductase
VVGRGWHEGPGRPHAEAAALREAGPAARGTTLYCTLEPCSHHGRTPPCAEALVAAGVARAVVALQDPNPLVDGSGLARLRAAGVEVVDGGGRWAARAAAQNAAFVKAVRDGLPLVTYKAAMSLDGKIAAAGGDARWISSLESRRAVHAMRAAADAVMVGAGTVRRDDPELTVRLTEGRDPVRVVVTTRGELPPGAKVLAATAQAATLVLATRFAPGARAALEARGAETFEMGEDGLRAGMAELAERGLLDVMCEGGPGLAGALLEGGLLDRVVLFVAPLVIGRGAPDLLAVPAVAAVARAWRLAQVRWETIGDDLLLRADVAASGSGVVEDGSKAPDRDDAAAAGGEG